MNNSMQIIQGGMGAGVSSWRLAHAVSALGQLGVVSGTALDQILARRLQDGDPGGHMRRALDRFPARALADRVYQTYFSEGGKAERVPYKLAPMPVKNCPPELQELILVANFVEVFLAREGHANPVGINYLEKIQIPHLPALYGALLAGVDYVLVGAGIPLKFPEAIDRLIRHEPATYPFSVTGAHEGENFDLTFVPGDYVSQPLEPLARPRFLAIVSSNVLATMLAKKLAGRIDGFIVEGPPAGGHNAPPRGRLQTDEQGSVVFGERDQVDVEKIRSLGLPFWLAGGYGSPEKLREALAAGAAGVQVGTAFAYCEESGFRADYKRTILDQVAAGRARVSTDGLASPTNFPFKVVRVADTLSEPEVYAARPRICDLGFLREAYRTTNGDVGYRCPAEPVNVFVGKGGKREETVGRKCICNALLAAVGEPQHRKGNLEEKGIVTSGDGLPEVLRFIPPDRLAYRAADVVAVLLGTKPPSVREREAVSAASSE